MKKWNDLLPLVQVEPSAYNHLCHESLSIPDNDICTSAIMYVQECLARNIPLRIPNVCVKYVCVISSFYLCLNRNILVFNKLIPTTEWTGISFGWKVLPMVSFSQTNNRALGCRCTGFPKSTGIPRYIFKGLLYQHYINLSL